MADVLIYNKQTGKIKSYLKSVNTPDYLNRNDVIINPKIPKGVPLKFLKVENGKVVEMSQSEKKALLQEELERRRKLEIEAINNLNVNIREIIEALIKIINKRLPSNKQITKQELITQIKEGKKYGSRI